MTDKARFFLVRYKKIALLLCLIVLTVTVYLLFVMFCYVEMTFNINTTSLFSVALTLNKSVCLL